MQFSVFDLQELNYVGKPEDGGDTTVINLVDSDYIMSDFSSYTFSYCMLSDEFPMLAPFGPDREFVFSIGGHEVLLTFDADGNIEGDFKLTDLDLTALEPEDVITMQLYQNGDDENVLWQYSFNTIYVERIDEEFPDVKLNWDDYYPVLGDKYITVRSDFYKNGYPIKAEIVSPVATNVTLDKTSVTLADGKAKFKLSAKELLPPSKVKIRFTMMSKDGKETVCTIDPEWTVRNNSITNLEEVLNGEAVFVYDSVDDDNHKGVTTGEGNRQRELDFVQELLNQVVPRKRSVSNYTLIEEKGVFNDDTKNAIETFKANGNFNIDNTGEETAKNDYNKLIKDYGLKDKRTTWKNQIIDNKILVCDKLNITKENADKFINGIEGATDTGLYELYVNVVEPFVDAMIAEGERYAGISGSPLPTENWISRTGNHAVAVDGKIAHGPGMSYNFGGKNSIEQFNDYVVNCQAPSNEELLDREKNPETKCPDNPDECIYRGNVDENCIVGGTFDGEGKWAGGFQGEGEHENKWDDNSPFHNYKYWAGIDCAGFIERIVDVGSASISETKINVKIDKAGIPWQHSSTLATTADEVFDFGSVVETDGLNKDEIRRQRLLKKGDIISNKNSHVAMVYKNYNDPENSRYYKIIHAYGGSSSDKWSYTFFDDWPDSDGKIFARKVVVTYIYRKKDNGYLGWVMGQNMYGRIKLWD